VQAEEDLYAPKEPSRGTIGKGLGDYEALAIVLGLAAWKFQVEARQQSDPAYLGLARSLAFCCLIT
jgi:hypothetical protein